MKRKEAQKIKRIFVKKRFKWVLWCRRSPPFLSLSLCLFPSVCLQWECLCVAEHLICATKCQHSPLLPWVQWHGDSNNVDNNVDVALFGFWRSTVDVDVDVDFGAWFLAAAFNFYFNFLYAHFYGCYVAEYVNSIALFVTAENIAGSQTLMLLMLKSQL